MVAMVLFVALSTATVSILMQSMRTVRENSQRVVAANVARTQLEYLRRLGTGGVTLGLSTTRAPGISTDYEVRSTAQWVGFGQTSSSCDAATPGQAYVRVTVDVSGTDLSAPVTLNSIIAPPTAVSTTGTGTAAISVVDQIGAPVSNVTVTGVDSTHPANAFSYTTGDDGCLYIPSLTPSASLVVTISRAGYVSRTPTGTTMTVPISTGSLARPTFYYAPGAGISFTGDREQYPLVDGFPVSWQVNETGATLNRALVGQPVADQWPSTSLFSAWAGDCADADPEDYSASRQSFPLIPGETPVVALDVRPVKLRGITADTPVTARHVGSAPGCTSTDLPLGRTDELGILRVSLPNGTWDVSAGPQTKQVGPLGPPAEGAEDPVTTVNFTLADLDNPSPSPSPVPSGSGSPSPSPEPSEPL
jgi:type II secretory pathway pseudopilin PulG